MRRAIAGMCVVAMVASGCVSQTHPKTAIAADLITLAGIVQMPVLALATCPRGSDDCVGLLFALTGVVTFALAGVLGASAKIDDWRSPAPPREPPPPPAPPVIVSLPDLPDLATDAATLQLARQARMAAVAHLCTAARLDLARIGERDAAYHDALVASAAFEACR